MISTTTCRFDTPLRFDNLTPTGNNQVFNYASSSCVTVSLSDSTSSPVRYDSTIHAGDILITFFLAIILAFLFVRFAIMDV